MEKMNNFGIVMKTITGAIAGATAWLLAKFGILFPVLMVLLGMMIADYVTGMLASKAEALEHPEDPAYGWSSKKGAKGIIKKVSYMFIIAVAMVVDFIILKVAEQTGIVVNMKAFFGLLVTVWYLLNELLSIIENVGRTGAPIPEWLSKYIAVLKTGIDSVTDNGEGKK